ncbi:hypothetical protein BRADI_2g32623v3, partial [Brachypodium distachyon]
PSLISLSLSLSRSHISPEPYLSLSITPFATHRLSRSRRRHGWPARRPGEGKGEPEPSTMWWATEVSAVARRGQTKTEPEARAAPRRRCAEGDGKRTHQADAAQPMMMIHRRGLEGRHEE